MQKIIKSPNILKNSSNLIGHKYKSSEKSVFCMGFLLVSFTCTLGSTFQLEKFNWFELDLSLGLDVFGCWMMEVGDGR